MPVDVYPLDITSALPLVPHNLSFDPVSERITFTLNDFSITYRLCAHRAVLSVLRDTTGVPSGYGLIFVADMRNRPSRVGVVQFVNSDSLGVTSSVVVDGFPIYSSPQPVFNEVEVRSLLSRVKLLLKL